MSPFPVALLVCVLVKPGAEAEVLRAGGYPGYVEPKFSLAPRRAEGRSLFYRSSPKVARARSSVHELYMRPYNYVSYKMGGSGGGSQYKYQYKTLHPQYGGYKPSPYQTPTPQPVTATPFYHSSPSPAYHTSAPYHAPTVATYQAPTYRYQPYSYPTTPAPTLPQCTPPPTANLEHSAVAVIVGDGVKGVIRFHQTGDPTSPVELSGNITGLTPGSHGFHIHQLGDTSNGCASMAGHFNPLQLKHGAPTDSYRHVGDLGNIEAGNDGVAIVKITDSQLSLNGLNSIIGRGVVVHAGRDDMGRGGDEGSLKTGNAGGRVGCGVVARAN